MALNRFPTDSEAELEYVRQLCSEHGLAVALTEVWAKGGEGGLELADAVIRAANTSLLRFRPLYDTPASVAEKIETICREVYEASHVQFSDEARRQIEDCERHGWSRLPICMAKTQYSFSDDPKRVGDAKDFTITIREVRPSLGAEFLVCYTGDILTMPGLPKLPNALQIDVNEDGKITGLF